MISFCRDCNKEQYFDDSWDEDCFRCSECGCLPYEKQKSRIINLPHISMKKTYITERGEME
jgi:hypothetical protein